MKRLILFCCLVAFARADEKSLTPPSSVPLDGSVLQAIAAKPAEAVALDLSNEKVSVQENRESFDQAFAACREALLADTANTDVRTNLGALYFFREKFHPEESGNFEKAINQFLIVLRDDPGNSIVLSYLRTYDVLQRVQPTLSDQGMDRILSALQQDSTEAESAESLWTLARANLFAGHLPEARTAAGKLIELTGQNAASFLLLGTVELKTNHPAEALADYRSSIQNTEEPAAIAVAKLGEVQALMPLGRLEEADNLLGEATSAQPAEDLERDARAAGILTSTELGWELGKAFANAGDVDRAVGYIGTETTGILKDKGVKAWNSGDKTVALDTFLQLLELKPDEEDGELYLAIGILSFDLKHYRDTVWAFREARNHNRVLSKNMLLQMGSSYLVQGDYEKAYAAFDEAHRLDPTDSDARAWRVGAAFGVGGWQYALDTLIDAPPLNPAPQNYNEQRLRTYDLAYGIVVDAEKRATEAGLRYPLLTHLSLHNELLSNVVEWSFGGLDRAALKKEKWGVIWQTINLYRALPLKPTPPARAVAQEAIAESNVRRGDIGYETEQAGFTAVEIAPWWPLARYNLGVFARDSWFSEDFSQRYVSSGSVSWSNIQSAVQEFTFYLHLAPQGPKAAEVRQQLKKWGVAIPSGL